MKKTRALTLARQIAGLSTPWLGRIRSLVTAALVASVAVSNMATAQPAAALVEQNAAALSDKHAQLSSQLASSPYGRPLYLESAETSSMVNGNAYAILDSPFSAVSTTLKSPKRWCEVMILHLNTKYCRATSDTTPTVLNVNIGKKTEQDLPDTFALEFAFRLASATPGYFSAQLNSDKGPLGTSNYRIELSAVPLTENKTFIHLRYSYGYGMAGKLAMQAYLATLGSGKVGFTQVSQGQKQSYVTGLRGAVERNTMRYYLAIDAYLASLGRPADQQFNARLDHWFNATEQYARQLHEVDKSSYLVMKKNEYQRQQNGLAN
ncbi:MAG: hypothetical protein V4454_14970 [Pseudomonadota bacterium]